MARLDEVIISGTRADQPDADSVGEGTLYRVSDEAGALERSNGTTWEATGGGGDLSVHILGPFTVNYNDANVLTTGVELFEGEAGYVIYNMWFEYTVAFTGSGGWFVSNIVMQTANDVIYPEDGGYWAVSGTGGGNGGVDNGTDVARLGHADLLGTFPAWAGYQADRWFPARMKVTTPILLKLVPTTNGVTPGGTMTAGQLKMYAMVGELA